VQLRKGGQLLEVALRNRRIDVPDSEAYLSLLDGEPFDGGAPSMIWNAPHVRLFDIFVDGWLSNNCPIPIRVEPGGLSCYSNIGLTREETGALFQHRAATYIDVCRALAELVAGKQSTDHKNSTDGTKSKRRRRKRTTTGSKQPRQEFVHTWMRYTELNDYQAVANELGIGKTTVFDRVRAVEAWIEQSGTQRSSIRANVSLDSFGSDRLAKE
jgi:hypothetical protein